MRRTPTTPQPEATTPVVVDGATSTAFDRAYAALVAARARYDQVAGDKTAVPELAQASQALAAARMQMAAQRLNV